MSVFIQKIMTEALKFYFSKSNSTHQFVAFCFILKANLVGKWWHCKKKNKQTKKNNNNNNNNLI